MQTKFFTVGLMASLATLVAASPSADTNAQLEGREPIICIGCVNESKCAEQSEPANCVDYQNNNWDACESKACWPAQSTCHCCDIVDGETQNCGNQ